MTETLLKATDVAERLSVPVSWVYRAAREGKLPCVRTGRYVRFQEAAVTAYVRAGGHRD